MEKQYQSLLTKLERELENFMDLSPLERMRTELTAVRAALDELREMVEQHGFSAEGAEIEFFKRVKPRFYSLLIFAIERYNFETSRPAGKSGEAFYAAQLEYISRFYSQYGFFYQYYKMQADELDGLYFLRGAKGVAWGAWDLPEMDPVFSTLGDYLFSKFIALERLRESILAEMQVPVLAGSGVVRSKKGKELRWTGESVNLIELVYGIFDCRQVNDGEVDLSDLMEVFEQCFQINLSRYFRRFTEIKRRKSMSKTRFLDEMARVVNKRIDDGDAYVPMSMR